MDRRRFLRAGGGAVAALAAPRLARAAPSRILRFVPNSDLTIVDPYATAAYVTRTHAFLAYDTLFGLDDAFRPQPQMVEGHTVEDDGRRWTLRLREGLLFHDGEPVLAQDVVASLRRWGRVDAFGQALMASADVLEARSDREVTFRLKAPFPLLPEALGKATAFVPVIMPARLANMPPGKPLAEVVGSGPFRYVASERVDGVRTVYERFERYVPRPGGVTQFTAGPKIAHLDRVEWRTISDDGTAAAALQQGEVDWLERPLFDLLPQLRDHRDVRVDVIDQTGFMGIIRFNHLHPPFDNPAIRRAALGMIDVTDLMSALAGADRSLWDDKVGVFCPESPMATEIGLDVLTAQRDLSVAKKALDAAGYRGERVVFLTPTNNQATNTLSQVTADALRQGGFAVELVALDFGAWLTRRANKASPAQGGWNATTTFLSGLDLWDPASHLAIRGNGGSAWSGWPTSPRLEELRDAWLTARDQASRQSLCRDIQRQVWADVPYIPGGRWRQPTAYRRNVRGVLKGLPLFYNVTV
ncbi:ABC transporter substrate-binding protein [Methylobacterium sp. A49B]